MSLKFKFAISNFTFGNFLLLDSLLSLIFVPKFRLHDCRFHNLGFRFRGIYLDKLRFILFFYGMFRVLSKGFFLLEGFRSILGDQVLISSSLLNIDVKYIIVVKSFSFISWGSLDQSLNLLRIFTLLRALVFNTLNFKLVSCLSLHQKLVCI